MSVTDELPHNPASLRKRLQARCQRHKGVAVVACGRLPERVRAPGLEEGQAHVIRAGGQSRTTRSARWRSASGCSAPRDHPDPHTDCGMLTFTDDDFKAAIQAETGIGPPGPPRPSTT